MCAQEESSISVLDYLVSSCMECRSEPGWLEKMGRIVHQYYVRDTRPLVKVAAVGHMKHCFQQLG